MNYDFSDKEFNLFVEIHSLINEFAKPNDLETKDSDVSGKNIRKALALLAKTPYLKLGLEAVNEYNGLLTLVPAMEVVSAASPSLYLSIESSTRIFGRIISTWGTDTQKEKLLPALLDGKILGAVGLSEDAMNVENDPLATTGVPDGEKVFVSGYKQYVVNAPHADWLAVAGMMEDKPALFLIEKETPGLIIGERTPTVGYEGVAIASIQLNGCAVNADQVISPKNGTAMLKTLRMWENQVLIGVSLGIMKKAFESAKTYAKEHKTGNKPIIAYQEVGFKLSEMLTLFQTSQLFAYRAAWTAESDLGNAENLILCAKVFCTESAEKVASDAMKIMGGEGFIAGNPVEQAFRCTKYGQIAGTSTEISRVKIGDAALGTMK